MAVSPSVDWDPWRFWAAHQVKGYQAPAPDGPCAPQQINETAHGQGASPEYA